MKKIAPLLIVAALALGGGFALQRYLLGRQQPPALAPEISLATLDGGTASLTALRGKLVLVNFWATWCAPCLKEIPLLVQMQDRYGPHGLQILGPAMDEPDSIKAMLPRLKIQYPILIGEAEIPKAMDALGDTMGALPFSVLISADGYVIDRKHGEFDAEELTALIEHNLPHRGSPGGN